MARFGKWKSEKGRLSALFIVLASIALVLAAGSVTAALAKRTGFTGTEKRYPEGTSVNGVSISGMTETEARRALDRTMREMVGAYSVRIVFPDGQAKPVTLSGERLKAVTDLDEVLKKARGGGEHSLALSFSAYRIRLCLADIARETATEPEPARIAFDASFRPGGDRFSIVPGRSGSRLDLEECVRLISSGETEITAPMEELPSEADAPKLPVLMGGFETSFAEGALSAPNRVFNIVKAAEKVNGSVVPAYAVFSVNEALGPRTDELGWRPAPGLTERGADTADQPGGGVCQLSTTLFNAALLADLPIIERQCHSRPIAYAEPGRDATIDTGSFDLKFKNDTGADIYVFAWADEEGLKLICEIWGVPKTDLTVAIETELVETVPPSEDEYELDESLPKYACVEDNPAMTGARYMTYRVYYRDGVSVRREPAAESEYAMHPRRLRVGRGYYKAIFGKLPGE